MTKFAGKPYAGKPHVRFDEGAGKGKTLPALLYYKIFVPYSITPFYALIVNDLQNEKFVPFCTVPIDII